MTNNLARHPTNGVVLHVIDKDGMPVGRIMARVGLKTYSGTITRLTPEGIEIRTKDGYLRVIRAYDHLPAIYRSYAPKGEVLPIPGQEPGT